MVPNIHVEANPYCSKSAAYAQVFTKEGKAPGLANRENCGVGDWVLPADIRSIMAQILAEQEHKSSLISLVVPRPAKISGTADPKTIWWEILVLGPRRASQTSSR